jgi:hypothetical protein
VLPFVRVGDLARRSSRGALKVESVLHDYNGGNLINYGTRLPGCSSGRPQRRLRRHRRQAFVDQAHRQFCRRCEPTCEIGRVSGRSRFGAGKRQWQTNDQFESVGLRRDREDPFDVTRTSCHGLDRRRQHPVDVASGDADSHRANIHTDANSLTHRGFYLDEGRADGVERSTDFADLRPTTLSDVILAAATATEDGGS